MNLRSCLTSLALLVCSTRAHAEDVALPDGSRWTLDGTTLRNGGMSATLKVFVIGVDCATGLSSQSRVAAAYLPPRYIGYERSENGTTIATACADGAGGALVMTVRWPGTLGLVEQSSVRSLLEYFIPGIDGSAPKPNTLTLFKPPLTQVTLSASTGVWDYIQDGTDASSTVILQQWPVPTGVSMLKLARTPATQRCDTVGFTGSRPSWAPASFTSLGQVKDNIALACADLSDGHLLLVTGPAAPSADATRYMLGVLDSVVLALGGAATSGSYPSASTYPPASTDPGSTYTPSSMSGTSGSTYNPPPASYDSPYTPPAVSPLRGVRISLHQLAAASTSMIDDGYGASLGYQHWVFRSRSLINRASLELGYNNSAKVMADAQFAVGIRRGSYDLSVALLGAVGFDGIGLGQDAATDRVYIPGEAYYGGTLEIGLDSLDVALAYYARNASDVDHEWRFEVRYLMSSGKTLFGRYTSYGDAATLLSVGLAL